MIWKLAAALGWTGLILIACTMPGTNLPSPGIVGLDKLVHFILFAVFGWLWLSVAPASPGKAVRNVLIAGLLFAGLTEIYQAMLPYERDPSALDAAANAAGLVTGIMSNRLLMRRRPRPSPR
jgi:VanZ family protein